jgi:hypothetical protein
LLTHCLSFWLLQLATRKSPARSRIVTNSFCSEEITPDVIYFTEAPGGPSYISGMSQQSYPAPFESDIRIDYALIVVGVGAALFAFVYLILVWSTLKTQPEKHLAPSDMSVQVAARFRIS